MIKKFLPAKVAKFLSIALKLHLISQAAHLHWKRLQKLQIDVANQSQEIH